jgi:hypothetical protein
MPKPNVFWRYFRVTDGLHITRKVFGSADADTPQLLLNDRKPRLTDQRRLGCVRKIVGEIRRSVCNASPSEDLLHSKFRDTIRTFAIRGPTTRQPI